MNEKEMAKSEVPCFNTIEELCAYINSLINQHHTYGTCVYAMSLAAYATFKFVSAKLQVTGFQASCADLDFLRQSRKYESGFQVLDFHNLLYPQYCNDEHFPSAQMLIIKHAKSLKKQAKQLLASNPDACSSVRSHWAKLANMKITKETNANASNYN